MKKYQDYKAAYPTKTDEQIIESLGWELSEKVSTIHKLLERVANADKLLQGLKKQKEATALLRSGFTEGQAEYYEGKESVLDSLIEELENTYRVYIGNSNGVDMFASKETLNNILHLCLCDGLHYFGGYGIDIGYDKADYKKAKEQLVTENKETVCFEDVIMRVLQNGGGLKFSDIEGEGENDAILFLNEETYSRFKLIPIERLLKVINEEYDAEDADVVIQTLVYGEILFG